ncbi:DUF998 domain-containing protein [Streptosporangium sp. NPDC049376]|uniref:DUF998 domain-containing protein n=1 Tax=Streptosporangium sp. NPDC049376 TaxID=3366192 RepID=UPI00379B51ED
MRPTTPLLTCGTAAGVLVPVLLLLDGATRPGYSLWHHGASQLGTGERGWLQTANFVIGGLLLFAFAAGMRRALPAGGRGWALYSRWSGALVIAFAVAAGVAFRLGLQGVVRPAPAGLLEHAALLVGFTWIVTAAAHQRRRYTHAEA